MTHDHRRMYTSGLFCSLFVLLYVSACTLSVDSPHLVAVPTTEVTATPTEKPTSPITPTKEPTVSTTPTICQTVKGVLLPTRDTVSRDVASYITLIFQGAEDTYQKVYALLSPKLQHQVLSPNGLKGKTDFVLFTDGGCWSIVQTTTPVLKQDGKTWEMWVLLVYTTRGSSIQSYTWHFQLHLYQGSFEIIGIGLYGTSATPPAGKDRR